MVRRRTRGAGPTAVAWLLLAQAQGAKGAVSSDDLLAYVGGTATGQTLTTAAYSLTMLANSTDCIVSLSWDGAMSDLGWLGWGLGTGMAKADIVVLWPNSDSSWTLSHRNAASTVMPTVVDSSATSDPSVDASGSLAVVASLSSSSSSDSPTVVTFSRPLTMPSEYSTDAEIKDLAQEINQPIIYAMGPTNPGDSDPATDFEQHALDSMGSTYMDLSATFSSSAEAVSAPLYSITGSSGGSSAAGGATSSGGAGATTAPSGSSEGGTGRGGGASSTGKASTGAGAGTGTGVSATATGSGSSSTSTATASTNSTTSTSSYTTIIKYHAYAGAAAWLFAAPMGVLIARLGRHCLFFPWHWGFQVFVTTVLTTIAVGLAFYSTKLKGGTVTKDAHVYLGFGILFLVYTQCGIGLWIHLAGMAASAAEKARGRASRNWLHIGLGIILLIAGFVQIKLGMTKYGVSSTSKLIYVYWGATALFSIIYLISALLAIANPPPPPAQPKKHHHHEAGRHHRHRPVHHSHRRERERREREKDEAERRRRRKKKAKKRRRRKEEEKNLISSDSESTGSGSGSRSGSRSGSGTESDSGSSTASSGKSRKRRR